MQYAQNYKKWNSTNLDFCKVLKIHEKKVVNPQFCLFFYRIESAERLSNN